MGCPPATHSLNSQAETEIRVTCTVGTYHINIKDYIKYVKMYVFLNGKFYCAKFHTTQYITKE